MERKKKRKDEVERDLKDKQEREEKRRKEEMRLIKCTCLRQR